jgi:hypothetical protein
MKSPARRTLGGILLLAGLFSTGCATVYRSETVLHDDGSIDRAIYQPGGDTPEAAKASPAWTQTTYAPDPDGLEKQGQTGPISSLAVLPPGQERPYFAAWGKFKSARDLPEHIVMKAPEGSGLPDGKLVRDTIRADYVFVVEHRWSETLIDIVTQEDMRKAREELAELLINVGADTFNEAVGKEYDGSALFKLLRTEGKPWLAEGTDFLFLYCATHKGPAAARGLLDGLADICARHGLVLKAQGKFLDDKAMEQAVDDFAITVLVKNVRRKDDGKPVDREAAAKWWREWKGKSDSQGQPQPGVFGLALKKVIATRYGGEAAYNVRLGTLFTRVLGLYATDLVFNLRGFDYTMTMPGEVVETNGEIQAGNQVRWHFGARDAYPLGFAMTCRSLLPQLEAQRLLLKGQPLESREEQLRFVSLVSGQERLSEALRDCRKQKKMTPLYDYRAKAQQMQAGGDEVKRVNALLRVLKLPPEPPAGG